MSWKLTLMEKCIVVNGAPRYFSKSQLSDIIQHKASTTNILLHYFQDVNNFDQWVLWLDSAESVNYLCDEIQEEQYTSDDDSFTVTFHRCDESNIPEAWLVSEELASSNKEFGDHHDKGSFLRSHTIESTFGKESQDQQKQTPIVKTKLSNLPEDTDTEFLELFLEQELGNGIDIISIELCKNGTEAIIEFENKNVHDVLMKRQPLDVEGQKVFVELIKAQPLIQGDPRSIEVSSDKGVITERTARTIRMYFSNNGRSDGGKIVEFKFEEATERIRIKFESAEVAKAVSERKDHRYKDAILDVVLIDEDLLRKRAYEDSKSMKSKAVRITNLPHEIDKDTLEVVFEDVETFGENISVVDVQVDPKRSSAIIEFSDAEVVKRILQKKTVDVEGHTINIEAFKEVNREEPCSVEVTGPADCLTENNMRALKMYFNNKKRSGGEDVINCCFRKPGLVEVTFEDSKVAKRVAEWDSHWFKSSNIHVNVKENKSDAPDKSNKLLFSDVDKAIKDVLVLYIEDMFENVHVKDEIPGDDESKVILEFDDSEGAKIVLQKQPLCIDGHDVGVSLYTDEPEKQCTIQVQGLPNIDMNIDALKMYFKNTNRSGGGTIVDCDCNKERNIAFITFETEEVAHSVVNRPNHELKGTMLEVTLCNITNHDNENESTRKILIKQLPESVDKEFLELFFEDFGDSDNILVENVEIGVNKSTATVEFHDEAAVDYVMKQTPLKIKENIVIVERYREEEEKDLSTIEVHGITDMKRNLEKVLLYFKNKRHSNGGNIVSHHVDAEKNIVSIKFESREVAERVVSHDHSNHGYKVILKTDQAYDEECPMQTIDTVKVRGVDKTVSLETLTYYFESKKRSGGGPIMSIRPSDEDENVVIISFEDPKDASYVSGRQHTVQNCTVRVSLYQSPPCYDDRILIKGLNSTKDALFLFLEATANVQPVRMDRHEEDESTVLVTLKEKPNFEKLEKACNERQLEGAWLKVSKVQVSHCILVSNLAPTITKDTLQYYFENKRKSGGGDVEKIVMNDDDDEQTCMIYFEDYKVIDDILDIHHTLGGRSLDVKRFQPVLGRPEGETEEKEWRLPRDIEIKDANIHKISFVTSSSKMRETFQQELIKTYTKIKWPIDIDHNVQLHCTLTRNDNKCFKIAKGWGKQAHIEFMRLMDTIVLHRIGILQDIRQTVMSFLQNLHVKDSTNVAIVNKKEEHLIFVVGTKTAADELKDVIEKGINKIIDAAEKEKQTVTEIFSNLDHIETKMLIFQHFSKELEDKFDDLNVEIKTNRNEIHLKGLINNVKSAQLAIYDRKSNFEVTKIRDISKPALTLLQLDGTRNALQCKLEAKSIRAVWEPSSDGIVVCCCKPSPIEKAVDIISSFICNEQIAIKKGTVPDLETEKWRRKIEEIYSKHPGKVKIYLDENQENIHICTLADIHSLVKEEVQRFLKANTITTKIISNSKEINRFLEKNCRKEIEDIYLRHQQYYVKIKHLDQFRGFEVQGLQKGVQDAIEQIRILIKKIKHQTHTVTKPGIAEHISSPKGKDSIHTIEYSLECVIVVEGDLADKKMTDKELGTRSHTTFHGTTIYVWQGDMTELEVDVLVNPSDKTLASSGVLGKAIFTKGGQMIRHDCNDYIDRYGSLKDGDVFISSAGDLKAKNVVHIKSAPWKNGTNMDRELESTVFMCLQKTANLENKSIAIPAIGCGVNGFPVDISTSSIVNALKRILMEYQDSSFREIYLCDMNTTNVEGFTGALQKVFGITNVVLNEGGKMDTITFPKQMDAGIKSVSGSTMQRSYDGNGFSESISGHRKDDSVVIGNVAVTVVKGEIAKQTADVIVNTTSNNLDLRNGAVSMSLSKSAGKALQDEVTAKYPDGLKNKIIAVTGGHKLHCNFVFHTAFSNYKDNNPKESITDLHKVIRKCLECAQQDSCQSIAFPAFGTGNLGYPRDIVAEEMFNAVIQFQNDNPKTSIQDVRFVIYQNDTQTLQAFKAKEARVIDRLHSASFAGKTGRTDKPIGYDVLHTIPSGTNQQTSGNFTFDSVNVMVKNGDITHENTDCIVNSTNTDLNLKIGKVSQKLMDKGGNALQEEIENHKSEMKRSKIVTTLAPGLPCKNIIHVKADSKDVAATVKKCLKEAENEKMNSIAMPVFGTGNIYAGSKTVDPATVIDVAKNMFKAVREFSKAQPRYIKEIRLVIFQTELLPEFLKAAEDVADSKSWYGNIWKGVKNVLGMSGPSHENSDTTFKTRPDYNSVSFIIIAMKDEVIRKAIRKLESSLEKEMHTKIIDDHTICQLEDIQVDEIHGIAQQCHVQMTMDKNKATIKLAGIVTNVMNASDKISTLLRDAERMEFLKNIAQWFYIEVSQTGEQVLPYGKDINMIIENAYKRQRSTVEYTVGDSDFILDFASMEEYPEKNILDKVKVIRRDLVKGGSFELPATWDDMKGGNLRVVSLTSGSTEYTAIEKQFKDSAGQYTDASGQLQDRIVVKIERVQNKVLWEQYQSKKKQLEEQNPGTMNERELWHGTSAEPVDSINAHGFNRSFCGKNATVFGDGVYFAINAKYSCQDTYSKPDTSGIKRMYLCKVLTGVFVKGERGMRVPPLKPNGGSHALYDSVTNDTKNPHMFIIFHDTQACPEYLIYFK